MNRVMVSKTQVRVAQVAVKVADIKNKVKIRHRRNVLFLTGRLMRRSRLGVRATLSPLSVERCSCGSGFSIGGLNGLLQTRRLFICNEFEVAGALACRQVSIVLQAEANHQNRLLSCLLCVSFDIHGISVKNVNCPRKA